MATMAEIRAQKVVIKEDEVSLGKPRIVNPLADFAKRLEEDRAAEKREQEEMGNE
ncbi:hypothetical protein VCHA38O209_50262 [Vibrio chagasii]|nr:hypothetical protein VCHA38O209_50262 [Vibrio chagasii]